MGQIPATIIRGRHHPLLAEAMAMPHKRERWESPRSEDVLTWNALVGEVENGGRFVEVRAMVGRSPVPLLLDEQSCHVWNQRLDAKRSAVTEAITRAHRALEAGPALTEFDLLLVDEQRGILVGVEVKLGSALGTCRAPAQGDCRLHRVRASPADNGCSYFGAGTGGDAFPFKVDWVRRYFSTSFRRSVNLADVGADCARYYQLMRNSIVGGEVARELGLSFHQVTLMPRRAVERVEHERYGSLLAPGAIAGYSVITWEDVGEALGGDAKHITDAGLAAVGLAS